MLAQRLKSLTPIPEANHLTCRTAIILANCKGNVGDFAILDAMTRHILSKKPHHTIDIFPDPTLAFSEENFKKFVSGMPCDKVQKKTLLSVKPCSKINKLRAVMKRVRLWRAISHYFINLHSNKIRNALDRFDLYDKVFIAGGGLWGANELTKFGLVKALSEKSVPIYCYPFTAAAPMWQNSSRRTLHSVFSLFSHPPFVREKFTKERFQNKGIKARYAPDIAFYLQSRARELPPAMTEYPNRVLFCLTRRAPLSRWHRRNMPTSALEADLSLSQIFSDLRTRDLPIDLISTCRIEDYDKTQKLAELHNLPSHYPETWQEFCRHAKSSSCLITNRLHGMILGILSGTPVLLIADTDKTKGIKNTFPEIMVKDNVSELTTQDITKLIYSSEEIVAVQDRLAQAQCEKLNRLFD